MRMQNTDFDDIKVEYNILIENLYQVHNLLNEIVPALSSFLFKYYKLRNYNKIYADKLESDLFHLEKFLQIIDDNLGEIEEVNLYKLVVPKGRYKVKNKYNNVIFEYLFK